MPVIGLEPSCILGFRDEIPALVKSEAARRAATRSMLFEEFVASGIDTQSLRLAPLRKHALLHGHCHQKSFGVMPEIERALKLIPDDTLEVSMKMGELSLLPAVRSAPDDAIIVADGTSCRHQIAHGTGREALHVARVLAMALQ
jgi:Fe-S oxidoreductase